jgi:hypothetical protein
VFALLAAINLSLTKTLADRYCNTRFGAFSSGFSKGFFVDRRGCPFLQSDAVPLGMP